MRSQPATQPAILFDLDGTLVDTVYAAGRRRALAVGLLSGGYSKDELEQSGAFRVYSDPADMLDHIEDLGIAGE
jgi:phosphoglycolate phosphatase-like HAD superfamily hydrolase